MVKFYLMLLVGISSVLYAQYPNQSILTLEQIMKGHEFTGYEPSGLFWSPTGDTLFYKWQPHGEEREKQFAYLPAADTTVELTIEQMAKINQRPLGLDIFSSTYQTTISNGSLLLWDPLQQEIRTIYGQFGDISRVTKDHTGEGFYYVRGPDWYHHHILTGEIKRLTRIESGPPPTEKPYPDSWLAREELALFEYLQSEKSRQDSVRKWEEEIKAFELRPEVVYMNKKSFFNLGISPDGQYAFYALSDRRESFATEVPQWITPEGEVKMKSGRAKVGTYPPGQELMILKVDSGETYTMDLKDLQGIFDKPAFLEEYADSIWTDKYSKPRDIGILSIQTSYDGKKIVADLLARDNKDRWIIQLLPEHQSFKLIDRQSDEAWIGGPGIRGWGENRVLGFIDSTYILYFQSEQDGFSHLYTYDFDTEKIMKVTGGNYEVHRVRLSRDNQHFYLKANKEDPGIYHWYKVSIDGNRWTQLTFAPGNWDLVWDLRERSFAALHSKDTIPKEVYLMTENGYWSRITHTTSEAFNSYPWRKPEYVTFQAADGKQVPARLYRPKNGTTESPAVLFVHGAGYLQNAHKYWSTYFREYMFHNFLADNGYTVLDIDYRGSAGYGRDWRTGIYRHMGGKDLSDHVDGVKFLVDSLGVDHNRIGIYGGSYGGFITIMALFKYPEIFKCGAALRSVTDWAHYNHGYTANILNTPEEDPIAFKRSSPIYFAEGLQGHLLILHGLVDMNVQVQDVVRLSQRLIELEKDNWEMAVYPVEDHGFKTTSSWLDEYKRIYKLFVDHLKTDN